MNASPAQGSIYRPKMTRSDMPPAVLALCEHCGSQIIRGKGGDWCHIVTDSASCSANA